MNYIFLPAGFIVGYVIREVVGRNCRRMKEVIYESFTCESCYHLLSDFEMYKKEVDIAVKKLVDKDKLKEDDWDVVFQEHQ